ncbi:uncharacterized protein CEXT_350121 [Caerostris extrusa]|uniref:SMB domain-containing protein n=1 Tax=Caerostris extrusa TaxID=172846 RepID=A0AAV4P7R6_CAEEX|nr:uncharacterized protein CEXT_350121 [Caerostris extrusa]
MLSAAAGPRRWRESRNLKAQGTPSDGQHQMTEIMDLPLSSLLLVWSGVMMAALGNRSGDGYPLKVSYGQWGANCYPVDSCRMEPGPQFRGRNCRCDDSCVKENACCFDAEFSSPVSLPKLKENERCISVDAHGPMYVVDDCARRYFRDSLCTSSATDSDDPLLMIPVTSTVTGTTYRNYFCALCNEDTDIEYLEPWNLEVVAWNRGLGEFSLSQLKYDRTLRSWTLEGGNSSVTVTTTVSVTVKVPDSLRETVVRCRTTFVDRCAHGWSDADVEEKCNAYMSLVEGKPLVQHRNPYCAICNYVDIKDVDCVRLFTHGGGAGAFAGGAGFRLIKLFYLKDRRCQKDMVYDKFHDICSSGLNAASKNAEQALGDLDP